MAFTQQSAAHRRHRPVFAADGTLEECMLEIASTVEPIQDGRIHIEKINGPFLFTHGGSPAEYGAGLALAIAKGWLSRHESGTYVKFTQAGADLFA